MASGDLYGRTLNIEDLHPVIALLRRHHYSKASYHELGLRLKLSQNTLEKIKKDHGDVDPCFRECLVCWLRKADSVECPTIDTLIDALRGIDNAAADGIEEERQTFSSESQDESSSEAGKPLTTPPTLHSTKICRRYDSTRYPNASIETHADHIFTFHEEELRCLKRPHEIASLLQAEGILSEDVAKKILSGVLKFDKSIDFLLVNIKFVINEDHKNLLIFARICIHTGNEDIGNSILTDCDAAFEQYDTNLINFNQVIGNSIEEIVQKVKKSKAFLTKLMSALRKRYCIMFSSIDDSMEVLKRDTTPFDTTPFEDIVKEVDCNTELVEFSDSMKSKRICDIPSRKLSCCAKLETLSIAMTCDSKTCADAHVIISTIFGDLLKKVVRCHDIKNKEGIVCYFPPVYSTLLIDRILKNFSFFKEMQIKTITVGFCTVYDEILFDKAYEKLMRRLDILEAKNLELEKLKQTLLNKIEELEKKIEELQKDKENFKKKALSLEQELKEKEEHIKELQSNEFKLKEKLELKDKVMRKTLQENEYFQSMFRETRDLEQKTNEEQKEIEILQDKVSLLSCQLNENKSYAQKERNSFENENKALARNLQQKTELSDYALQQLAEAKAEIGILQEMLSAEKRRNITTTVDTNNPVHKQVIIKEETTNQPTPVPQQEEFDPHTENITVSDSEITLTAPSLKTCKEIQIQQAFLSLNDAFVDSASAILLKLPDSVTYLHINRTPLSHDSVHSIIQLLQRLKTLRLTNVSLPSTSLSYILNILLTNESLEEFTIQFNSQMILPLSSTSAASYAQAISDIVRRNSTLQYFSALGLKFNEAGVVKILLALASKNNTLRMLTLDQSHQDTAYRFAEANGPIKDRLSFL